MKSIFIGCFLIWTSIFLIANGRLKWSPSVQSFVTGGITSAMDLFRFCWLQSKEEGRRKDSRRVHSTLKYIFQLTDINLRGTFFGIQPFTNIFTEIVACKQALQISILHGTYSELSSVSIWVICFICHLRHSFFCRNKDSRQICVHFGWWKW
jgi:hypothetical protein